MPAREFNFDALVGPTHNYAGLAHGNLASARNRNAVSNPRRAALEGLAKMKFLAALGVPQGFLPPPPRPDVALLRRLGYAGDDAAVLARVAADDPVLLAAACSASAMWAANAATVSPGPDCLDGRVHFTPANLVSQLHRSAEARTTAATLKRIFPDESRVAHHAPLPSQATFADEGAANHTRLCAAHDRPGVEVFVYGRDPYAASAPQPRRFTARQSSAASRAVARLHGLDAARTVFLRQNPDAVDAGVFHNDVAAVGNENVLLCHARAYVDQDAAIARIRSAFTAVAPGVPLHVFQVADAELTLDEAVETYLFNSQIVTLADGSMALVAPGECEHHPRARAVVDRIVAAGTPIRVAHFVSVRQSMRNGGGPACLRLRVVLNDQERATMNPAFLLNDDRYDRLVSWITNHYRETLTPAELADPKLLEESQRAQTELYSFL
jgi:succinylarginine dihydrolase